MGVTEARGKMMAMLWASPPAGGGGIRKKRGEIGRDDLFTCYVGGCWWLIFDEIMPATFYAPVSTIKCDRHTLTRMSRTVRLTTLC